MLKQAGAKEVHMRISAPPFTHSCHFGTDIDSEENLIANKMSIPEICQHIGADSLGYISIKGLKEACHTSRARFCTGCFSGEYPIDVGQDLSLIHISKGFISRSTTTPDNTGMRAATI